MEDILALSSSTSLLSLPTSEAGFVEAVKQGEGALERGEYLLHESMSRSVSGSIGCSSLDGSQMVGARSRRFGAHLSAYRKR
jgi:hypothetical protein